MSLAGNLCGTEMGIYECWNGAYCLLHMKHLITTNNSVYIESKGGHEKLHIILQALQLTTTHMPFLIAGSPGEGDAAF